MEIVGKQVKKKPKKASTLKLDFFWRNDTLRGKAKVQSEETVRFVATQCGIKYDSRDYLKKGLFRATSLTQGQSYTYVSFGGKF